MVEVTAGNRVIKMEPFELGLRQLDYYQRVPKEIRPSGISSVRAGPLDGTLRYAYDYVQGRQATSEDALKIIDALAEHVWLCSDTDRLTVDLTRYASYMAFEVCSQLNVPVSLYSFWSERTWDLTVTSGRPAREVHGDVTLDNTIITPDGKVILIDPGHPRGLCCVELDVAKLMQSLWLDAMLVSEEPDSALLESIVERAQCNPRLVDVLELSHWLRLLRHRGKFGNSFDQVKRLAMIRISKLYEYIETGISS